MIQFTINVTSATAIVRASGRRYAAFEISVVLVTLNRTTHSNCLPKGRFSRGNYRYVREHTIRKLPTSDLKQVERQVWDVKRIPWRPSVGLTATFGLL